MSHGHDDMSAPQTFAMVAEFGSAEELLTAAEATRLAGYKKVDAYTPFPVHGLSDAIGFHDPRVPWIIFMGGLLGGTTGYTLQWYTAVIDYPHNVGGKPLNSLPSFIPITFECTILFSAFTALFAMLALNGLPKPYHSIFNTPGFERASQDRFFLSIEAEDEHYSSESARKFLEDLHPIAVNEVNA
jgi:ActD protein